MMHFVKKNKPDLGKRHGPWETICSHKFVVWGNEATRTWRFIDCPECLKLKPVVDLGEIVL